MTRRYRIVEIEPGKYALTTAAVRATCEAGEDVKDMGESEAKAPETADQPVESAARRQTGTKYEAVAQASQVAHHYIVPPPRDLSLIRFALHRLMERAYWLAAAAAQDISGRPASSGRLPTLERDTMSAPDPIVVSAEST